MTGVGYPMPGGHDSPMSLTVPRTCTDSLDLDFRSFDSEEDHWGGATRRRQLSHGIFAAFGGSDDKKTSHPANPYRKLAISYRFRSPVKRFDLLLRELRYNGDVSNIELLMDECVKLRAALLAAERQRNLAEETLTRVETERLVAVRERDEAKASLERWKKDAIGELYLVLDQAVRERDEAREWAVEFKGIADRLWDEHWSQDDLDKLFEKWPTLPDWLREKESAP
jgi:hypothetical protein